MSRQGYDLTNSLKRAGEYLEERDIDADAATVIGAAHLALEENRNLSEVIDEVVGNE